MNKKYSGKQITKAGEDLKDTRLFYQDRDRHTTTIHILSYWRFCHADALETAFAHLQRIVLSKDKDAIFAKRLKRHISIVLKLRRFKTMKLKNMQDIGGARAVLSNLKKLKQVVRELKRAPFFRGEKNKLRFKDYLYKKSENRWI